MMRVLQRVLWGSLVVLVTAAGAAAQPTVTITDPTSSPELRTPLFTLRLRGTATVDPGRTIVSVTWVNSLGGSGTATGTTSWDTGLPGVTLLDGFAGNVITVTVTDDLAATATDVITVRPTVAQPTISEQPAATLLLPYFAVDLANPAGPNTLFSVNNASALAGLARVTLWSDMHVPVFAFDMYLTGYDMQTIDLRAVLNGQLPGTATAGQDPTDTVSRRGPLSQDINYVSCSGVLPPAPLGQATIDHLKAALTGQASPLLGGQCASRADGTQVARGYVTVDSVTQCSANPNVNPSSPGYFVSGGAGIADNRNILWGDYLYTNHLTGAVTSDGSPLVHIRANVLDPETAQPGQYTFYGRLVSWSAADNREPLSTRFGVRFVNTASQKTSLTVWRDPAVSGTAAPFACGGAPAWYPLSASEILVFDEQETPELAPGFPVSPPPPAPPPAFGAGTQRVTVGGGTFATAFLSGWIAFNLNLPGGQAPGQPFARQAWVSAHQVTGAGYGVGWPAAMFDSARRASSNCVAGC